MPNVWTHLLFGQEILANTGISHWISRDDQKRMFNMGCQGPDFLFYHQFLPWQRNKVMNELGNAMHNKQCGPFLLDLIDSVPKGDMLSRVYALGFLLHHILDRNMHPYVFVRSGFRKWDHQRFEVLMDTHILHAKRKIATWNTPVWKEIDTGGQFPKAIVSAFTTLTSRYYPELSARIQNRFWNDANRDMVGAQKLFHDPAGIKQLLSFNQIEPFVYKRNPPAYDVLNEAKRPWPDPTGTGEIRTTSIWEMWEVASEDAKHAVSAATVYWSVKEEPGADQRAIANSYAALQKAISNRSYETGLPLDQDRPIIIEDPIWEH
ncbi:zinc dependent phospholipase C family protein [Paenibacillus alvei]|uniref:Zinc dependent phospholipase C family protein n=1 Tax=Paenibacillus alvei TaxID=44250 RepID=A0AAP7DIY0_PAEAL|nr:zinc dependent phospholipase C family protein [Paenibacillus alvei]MBG9734629.1 hypothetical protein [Paenibacillus alvei]MBG9743060.1 hypothetical protein [Paenibacillus alvei]MCY9582064.1 zinc dependent phospholipase C family protein [Paenibacillus alvei]MCY9587706.1 zinc dependent phospholipase C family protein [Paenibacillus alvei]NOJ72112.1 zinc dependent phospholipase C family protein [Paenibacillus alvei]